MPEISLPEVKLPKIELPEGLREMTRDDIQKALPDIRLPKIDLQKQAERFAGDVGRNIENALPRKPGPSPVPFAILAMVGGIVVGWILATSPATQPRITGFMDWLRARIDAWRNRGLDDLDDDFETSADEMANVSDLGITSGAYAGAGAGTSTLHTTPTGGWSNSAASTATATGDDAFGNRTGGGVGSEPIGSETTEEGEETLTGDFHGQSLGAASADDFRRTDDPELVDDLTPGTEPAPTESVVVEEVIIVDEAGNAGVGEGSGRLTDTMQIDDTEGDDAPGTGRV